MELSTVRESSKRSKKIKEMVNSSQITPERFNNNQEDNQEGRQEDSQEDNQEESPLQNYHHIP